MEKYKGTKFETIFALKKICKEPNIEDLKRWGKILDHYNCIPHYVNDLEPDRKSSAGNLSFRTKNGFVITASYSDLSDLRDEDFVEVTKVEQIARTVKVIGVRSPSSESMMHAAIYKKRKMINAIFHGHFNNILQDYRIIGLPATKKFVEYGSIELIESVMEILNDNNFIILKNHGYLSLANDIEIAGKEIINIISKLTTLRKEENG